MNPEEQKDNYQPPAETNYFAHVSEAPQEVATTPVQAQEVPQADPTRIETAVEPDESIDPTPLSEVVRWQAPEYIHQQKGALWFIGFGLVVIALVAAAILLIKSWTFAILIPVMAFALIAYTYRPPRTMEYTLSEKGLYINDTLHGFAEFKGFGVIHNTQEYSVEFVPVRRFRPSLSVFFPEDKGEQIVDLLGVRLPMQQLKPDAFDRIVRFLGL